MAGVAFEHNAAEDFARFHCRPSVHELCHWGGVVELPRRPPERGLFAQQQAKHRNAGGYLGHPKSYGLL